LLPLVSKILLLNMWQKEENQWKLGKLGSSDMLMAVNCGR